MVGNIPASKAANKVCYYCQFLSIAILYGVRNIPCETLDYVSMRLLWDLRCHSYTLNQFASHYIALSCIASAYMAMLSFVLYCTALVCITLLCFSLLCSAMQCFLVLCIATLKTCLFRCRGIYMLLWYRAGYLLYSASCSWHPPLSCMVHSTAKG